MLGASRLTATRCRLGLSTLSGAAARVRCPVAIVRAPLAAQHASRPAGPGVVHQDGTAAGLPALGLAFEIAGRTGSSLQAMCPPEAERRVRNRIAAARPEFPSVQVVRMASAADPLEALLQASPGAAAVVVDRRWARLAAVRRGSASRGLLNAAGCPVVLTAWS